MTTKSAQRGTSRQQPGVLVTAGRAALVSHGPTAGTAGSSSWYNFFSTGRRDTDAVDSWKQRAASSPGQTHTRATTMMASKPERQA